MQDACCGSEAANAGMPEQPDSCWDSVSPASSTSEGGGSACQICFVQPEGRCLLMRATSCMPLLHTLPETQ